MTVRSFLRPLGSTRVGTALMLAWALLLVVWVVPFHFYGLPAERIRAIVADEPFFIAVYAALLLSTVVCIGLRTASVVRRALFAPSPESRPRMGSSVTGLAGPWDAGRAEAALGAAGYRQVVLGEGWAWGVRRRWGPLGTLLFHGSFILVAASVLLAYYVPAFSGSAVVAEGETFSGTAAEYADIEGSAEGTPAVPAVAFKVDEMRPRFHDDVLLFTQLDARVTANGRPRLVRVGTPWFPSATTMVRLEDFGYALEIEEAFDPKNVQRSSIKLKAFPSGLVDSFQYDDNSPNSNDKYVVTVAVYGDYKDRGGKPGVASYNLKKPYVDVTIDRLLSNGERRRLVDGRVAATPVSFALPSGPFTIAGVSEWGRFRVTRDPSMPLMLAALLLAVAGLVLRLALPRTEALLSDTGGASVSIAIRRDVYGADEDSERALVAAWNGGGGR